MSTLESEAVSRTERSDAQASPLQELVAGFCANRGAVAGLAVIVILLLLAIFADLIAPHAPGATNNDAFLLPPAWQAGSSWS